MEFPQVHPLVIIWAAIIILVFIGSFFSYLNRRNKYRLLETLAEKGQTLSPELLANIAGNGRSNNRDDRGPIAQGIFLMCVGVALAVFFWAMQGGGIPLTEGRWLAVIGIFPFMVGLARLLGGMVGKNPSK